MAALSSLAAIHGRVLHDVPGDNACQFHALLHALNTQLDPARALDHDVGSVRDALVATLDDAALLERIWLAPGDGDAVGITTLRAQVLAQAARMGRTLPQWYERMRRRDEWGDGATLIAAALLFQVNIHVLSIVASDGVYTVSRWRPCEWSWIRCGKSSHRPHRHRPARVDRAARSGRTVLRI